MKTQPTNPTVQPSELSEAPPSDWLLLDVRSPVEFGGAHIEGSLNAPLGSLSVHLPSIRERGAGKRVALVCRTGRRADEARKQLESASIDALHVLDGGIVSWERAGLPLLRGAPSMSLERQVRIAAGALTLVGVLLGFFVHRFLFGIPAAVGAGLVFAGLTDTCGMGMLLARMPWNNASSACPKD